MTLNELISSNDMAAPIPSLSSSGNNIIQTTDNKIDNNLSNRMGISSQDIKLNQENQKNIRQSNQNERHPYNRRYDNNTLSIVDNADNYYNNNYRLTKERPLMLSRSRKYGQHDIQEENSDESIRFHPHWQDYDRSKFGDNTYNFFLNGPMRGDVAEDWKYPPQYYYIPKFNSEN